MEIKRGYIMDVRIEDFKQLVKAEFGPGLRKATPANVREFLDKLQQEVLQNRVTAERFIIDEPATTYEEVIKDFFARILDAPPEEAIITLWALALDLSFAAIEYQYEERFASLFREAGDL